ncbi:MAG: hypothetical protein K0R57_4859 [Paenibacillaceae bacterium]|nr:hypothetical protein [Paenibacillaceae bacterium]
MDSEGLAAYGPDGKRLWMRKEWTTPSGTSFSAQDKLWKGAVDSRNNLYLAYANGLLVLNESGELLALKPGRYYPAVLEDGTILISGSAYRVSEGEIKLFAPAYFAERSAYVSEEEEETVSRIDPDTGDLLWTYSLPEHERNMGYSLFNSTLVSDKAGNMYISTTGGSVHSLDQEGNLRFILHVDDKTISGAEVIPLSETRCLVVVGSAILLLETDNGL